jgi:hypothetical protein
MRGAARLATSVALVLAPLLAGPSAAGPPAAGPAAAPGTAAVSIPLPQTFRNISPISCVKIVLPNRKDRCRTSKVPSTVDDREAITVGVGPNGDPVVVTDRQRLVVHGPGTYLIYELGPARKADGLNEFSQPQAKLGQVVWEGFVSGATRELDGLLTLDAGLEAGRLPMAVRIEFTDSNGKRVSLQPGGRAPSDGTATITLLNLSTSPRFLAVGTAAVDPLAHALDTLLTAANADRERVPPYAGAGLPVQIPGTLVGQTETNVTAPLRVHGTVTVAGSTGTPVTGPGTQPTPGGATVSGTLSTAAVSFQAELKAGQQLAMSLDVQPWLDPRAFGPPDGAGTWTAWAGTHPAPSAVTDATATLVSTAAQAARAADYSPYLQTDTHGEAASSFHYEIASETATRRAGKALTAKPAGIIAACLAGLAIAGNAALLRRQW